MILVVKYTLYLLVAIVTLLSSCSKSDEILLESEEVTYPQVDDSTLSKGVNYFSVEIPILDRFEDFVVENGEQEVAVELYLRGRENLGSYKINALFNVVDSDTISFTSTDEESLSALHHQEYFLNYITICGATRSSVEEVYPDGAIVIGAILSVTDPDDIYFITSFSANSTVYGSGSQFDPYIIASVDDFNTAIVDELNSGNTLSGNYFLQSDDLDFAGVDIDCIGESNAISFKGHYDGGMMEIKNLTMTSSENHCGLFYGIGADGVFCNSIFRSVSVSGEMYVGILASNLSGGVITNVFIEDGCRASGELYVGGFVGSGYGSIIHSVFRGSVVADGYCGGFFGAIIDQTDDHILYDNLFSGSVETNPDTTYGRVGGLVGYVEFTAEKVSDTSGSLIIEKVLVSGSISSSYYYVGGLLGYVTGGAKLISIDSAEIGMTSTITDYMSYGEPYEAKVTISADRYVGGLIGNIFNSFPDATNATELPVLSCSNSYFSANSNTSIDGSMYVAGAIGRVSETFIDDFTFTNYANVEGDNYTGGVVGAASGVVMQDVLCINNGDIGGSSYDVAGNIGYLLFNVDLNVNFTQTITFYNYGNITGSDSCVGGCVGYLGTMEYDEDKQQAIEITYNNYGCVSGYEDVGGFIGKVWGHPFSTGRGDHNSEGHYNVIVSGTDRVGGMYGYYLSDAGADLDINDPSNIQVVATGDNVGGIIGQYDESNMNLDLFNPDELLVTVSDYQYLVVSNTGGGHTGGLIGSIEITFNDLQISTYDYLTGSVTTSSSTSSGTTEHLGCTGGVLGGFTKDYYSFYVTFSNCYNRMNVTNNNTSTGGIMGVVSADEGSYIEFENCCNWGAIVSNSSDSRVGGILGYSDEGEKIVFNSCYNAGAVKGSDHRGGILGRTEQYCDMRNCFNMGSVPAGGYCVAGLIGSVDDSGSEDKLYMRYCYNIGTTGWGTIGGDENLKKGEIDVANVYYYDSASGGDIDLPNADETTKRSRSQMLDLDSGDLGGTTYWSYPTGSSDLPYLRNISYYEYKPAI